MFTFSFSSAFAADVKTAEDYLNDAYAALSTKLNSDYTAAVKSFTDDTVATSVVYRVPRPNGSDFPAADSPLSVKFSAKVKTSVAGDVKQYFSNVLDERLGEVLANTATLASIVDYGTAETALKADVADTTSDYVGVNVTDADFSMATGTGAYATAGDFQKDFLKYALDEVKKDADDHLARVDLSLYPDTVMDSKDPFKMTHFAFATKLQGDYRSDLADIVVSAEDLKAGAPSNGITPLGAIDLIAAKIAAAQAIDAKVTGALVVSGVTYTYKFVRETYTAGYAGATPVALAEKDTLDENSEAVKVAKAAALADAQKKAAQFKKDALDYYNSSLKNDAAKNLLAKSQKEADAFVEVWTVRIDESATAPTVDAFTYAGYDLYAANTYTKVVEAYEALVDAADAAKLEVGEAGTVKYVASIIDENLADAKVAVYNAANNAAGIAAAATIDVTAGALKEASLEWAKEVALAQLADAEKATLADRYGNEYYYEKEASEVAAAYDKVEAAINACTTVAQVKAVNKTPQIATIPKKAAVVTRIQGLVKFSGELKKLNTYLTAQNMLSGATKTTDDGYRAQIVAEDLAKFYAKNGARTNEEIVALLADAQAWAMTNPTTKELKDEKAALEAQIAALPKLVTLADKEAVKAAWEANDDRSCAAPKNEATLDAAVAMVKGLEKNAIDKLVDALPSKITAANKAAVQAIADAIKVYNTEAMYNELYVKAAFDLTTAKNAVRDSELAALEEAIAKLPKDATAAQVKAVRDQFDAFVAEYTDAETGYDAAAHVSNAYRLEYAEKLATEVAEENAKAYVQDLKIAARSAKTSKGVKVTIKADVQELLDAGFTVEYKFYRSTKSNKNFGKAMITKTTGTYTNTKGVKGTKYYYKAKIVVKNAEGEVVATTPLTQCLYATRTF